MCHGHQYYSRSLLVSGFAEAREMSQDLKEGSEEVAGCDSGYAKKRSAASSMFKPV